MIRFEGRAEGQRQRAQTIEGAKHLARMREAAAAANRSRRQIPEKFRLWNNRMRKAGVPQAERLAAIRDAIAKETTES